MPTEMSILSPVFPELFEMQEVSGRYEVTAHKIRFEENDYRRTGDRILISPQDTYFAVRFRPTLLGRRRRPVIRSSLFGKTGDRILISPSASVRPCEAVGAVR